MSFDAYTTAGQGQNLFQQLCVQSTRDPVNGVDFNDPGGGPYQIGRRWFNKTNDNYWRYVGQGEWVLDSSSTGPLLQTGVPAGSSPIRPDLNGLINFTSSGGTVTISGSSGGLGAQNINFDIPALNGPMINVIPVSGDISSSILCGNGNPDGIINSAKGSLFLRTDGSSSSTRAYINTDGAITWTPLTTIS